MKTHTKRKIKIKLNIPNIVDFLRKSSGSSIDLAWQDMFCHTASAIQKWYGLCVCVSIRCDMFNNFDLVMQISSTNKHHISIVKVYTVSLKDSTCWKQYLIQTLEATKQSAKNMKNREYKINNNNHNL